MKKLLLIPTAMLALVACDNDDAKKYGVDFANTGATGYASAKGTATYTIKDDERMTTLKASGLMANKAYVAHYHKMGDKSKNACASGGDIVGGVIGDKSFTSDANGTLNITGKISEAKLNGAAYINIHEADNMSTIPLCADLSKVTKQD